MISPKVSAGLPSKTEDVFGKGYSLTVFKELLLRLTFRKSHLITCFVSVKDLASFARDLGFLQLRICEAFRSQLFCVYSPTGLERFLDSWPFSGNSYN